MKLVITDDDYVDGVFSCRLKMGSKYSKPFMLPIYSFTLVSSDVAMGKYHIDRYGYVASVS